MPGALALRIALAAPLAAAAVLLAGCGGSTTTAEYPFRVTLLSLAADAGFPAPATAHVTLARGEQFQRLARLVPRPPPPPYRAAAGHGVTICVPVILTIRLADRHRHAQLHTYRGCQRTVSLRPLLREMCPLLRRPDFCSRYRNELAAVRTAHSRRGHSSSR